MWPFAVFVDKGVAFGMMPLENDLDDVAREFDAILILVEDFELPYSPDEWRRRGLEVLHIPVPDRSAPSLNDLLLALRWIKDMRKRGKKVLVHCAGGRGRSGTVAVAWLMYSKGFTLGEALRKVRSLRPGAVETESQLKLLRRLELALRTR